jgi:hypothetical protein
MNVPNPNLGSAPSEWNRAMTAWPFDQNIVVLTQTPFQYHLHHHQRFKKMLRVSTRRIASLPARSMFVQSRSMSLILKDHKASLSGLDGTTDLELDFFFSLLHLHFSPNSILHMQRQKAQAATAKRRPVT